ncbi:hypothetical protein [Paenibacillus agilis]|uniref:Uncharacterized protein n=1 Tax=Paenibacillus agilis TaxID=3020863 RepID=A0A559IC41_9BACL|nr:hypothetical protein [Paenibacillus agilis]TVX85225.1 hypothetical protein FPZ44_25215 [Paenibacillus agilis]
MWEKIIEMSLGFLLDLVNLKYPMEVVALFLGLAILYGAVQFIALRCFRTKDSMPNWASALISAFVSLLMVGMIRFILKMVQSAWPDLGLPRELSEYIPLIVLCMLIALFACLHLFIIAVVFRENAMHWNGTSYVILLALATLVSSILLKAVYSTSGMTWNGYLVAGGITALISTTWYSLHALSHKKSLELSG